MILCVDFGERYVGLAITDPGGRLALRHSVIDQKKQNALAALREIIKQEAADKILVGVPLGLSGQETPQTFVSLKFIEQLRGEFGEKIKVESVDETLTSVEAARVLAVEGGRPEDEHMEAARLMLEQYLRQAS